MNDEAIQISWHALDRSEALEGRIREEVHKLTENYPRATACRVVVERPHHRHTNGSHFVVKVELSVPGKLLVAARDPAEHPGSDDPFVACTEAFNALRRQLEHFVEGQRDPSPREARRQKRHVS